MMSIFPIATSSGTSRACPRRRAGRRLLAHQGGQAAVETMFAITVLVLLILVIAQLFVISDLSMGVVGGAHYQATRAVHDNDAGFREMTLSYSREVRALPGMEMALRHWDQGGTPSRYRVERSLRVMGGAFQGQGLSSFALFGDFEGWSHTGQRLWTMSPWIGY